MKKQFHKPIFEKFLFAIDGDGDISRHIINMDNIMLFVAICHKAAII